MATKNFTQFDLRTSENLNLNDYVVGYKADGTAEIRTTVNSLTGSLANIVAGATGPAGPVGATGASGFSFNYTPVTTNINLQTNTGYIANTTTTGTLTGTLPASPSVGHFVNLLVTSNSVTPFVIDRNGNNINSGAENLICDVTANFTLVYTNSTIGWRFVPFAGISNTAAKIFKANMIPPFTGPGIDEYQYNLTGPNPRVPFNNTVLNTDVGIYGGLENPGNKNLTSVLVKEPGYYRVDVNLHLMDLQEGRELLVQIWQYRDGEGDQIIQTVADTVVGTVSPSIGFIPGSTVVYLPNPNTYIYVIVNNNVPFPGPFASAIDNFDGSGSNGPSEIIITKIG